MSRTRTLKGHCSHCDGLLEFPAESTGMTVDCPLCGQATELLLARPAEEPTIPRATLVWTAIAVLVLVGGLIAVVVAQKLTQRLVQQRKAASAAQPSGAIPPALATNPNTPSAQDLAASKSFRLSPIELEKVAGSSLVYAVGTVTNATDRQRFGVKVELDLLDSAGKKIGATSDYQGVIEPKAEWRFRALVVDPKLATSARLADIKEQQ
jgi:hypothetical protein